MKYRIIIYLFTSLTLLSSCGMNPTVDPTGNQGNDTPVEVKKLSTSEDLDQREANQAKEILTNKDELTAIKAVNTQDKLVVGIEVYSLKRFQLKKIQKQVKKELESEFPTTEVILSTDQKIFLELDKLEKELQSNSLSKDKLAKKVNKLIKLANKET